METEWRRVEAAHTHTSTSCLDSHTPAPATAQTSMSGISVNDQCVAIFNHIKTKSAVSQAGQQRGADARGAMPSNRKGGLGRLAS